MYSALGLFLLASVASANDGLRALASPKCPKKSPLDSNGNAKCSDGLTCTYGEESCCGETFDSLVCDCFDGEWACRNTDACFRPACLRCPVDEPVAGDMCTTDPRTTCAYGQESCCGETFDSFLCDCVDGEWICLFTDACLEPLCLRCPIDQPDPGDSCTVDPRETCAYGTESCCGETFDSLLCECIDGEWTCLVTDACLDPPCQQCPEELPGTPECSVPLGKICSFGTESCCGETFDEIECTCEEFGWACLNTDTCLDPPCQQCPEELPSTGDECSVPLGKVCGFGTESCCGGTFDEIQCTCEEFGWACLATDTCLNPPCEQP